MQHEYSIKGNIATVEVIKKSGVKLYFLVDISDLEPILKYKQMVSHCLQEREQGLFRR
jgi:hypothetical protein